MVKISTSEIPNGLQEKYWQANFRMITPIKYAICIDIFT